MTPLASAVAPTPGPVQHEDDWFTYFRMLKAGQLDSYMGKFVAILNGQVVSSGADREELRTEASSLANVSAEQIVVAYVDGDDIPLR